MISGIEILNIISESQCHKHWLIKSIFYIFPLPTVCVYKTPNLTSRPSHNLTPINYLISFQSVPCSAYRWRFVYLGITYHRATKLDHFQSRTRSNYFAVIFTHNKTCSTSHSLYSFRLQGVSLLITIIKLTRAG